ncbi:glutamate racemase [Methylobacillus rhizosphaerae]|uniref:glutamate racemase n=1 Tax=Methylobacillus rhizosphaerae TaxID=551994 RepID=UPI000B779CAE|nr:glutamate racemase [Methylobacillus rhizosphaerae]
MSDHSSEKPAPVIGVFDSGVGGLSVLRHIREQLPDANLLYFADSLHAPYGSKTSAYIIERARKITHFLLGQGAQAIVVACNTATAAAIKTLRQEFAVPVIGMEPAVKPAVAATRSGIVGVLATSGTLRSAQFAALLESYGQHIKVETQACTGLVERIEQGDLASATTRALVQQYVAPLIASGADTIVLGCTHYPFVETLIAEIAGPEVVLIDTGEAVARQLCRRLHELTLPAENPAQGTVVCWTNNDTPEGVVFIRQCIGGEVSVQKAPMDV